MSLFWIWNSVSEPKLGTLMSLLPTAMPISARSLSNDDIISVTLFFWWLVISFNFWSSESMEAKELWWWTITHITKHLGLVLAFLLPANSPKASNCSPISRSAPHWEPQTLWFCFQLPDSSGRSWQPAPPGPAALPSLPPWRLHSPPAAGSAPSATCRGHGERMLIARRGKWCSAMLSYGQVRK